MVPINPRAAAAAVAAPRRSGAAAAAVLAAANPWVHEQQRVHVAGEEIDRYSFDDSDRFEEDSLCSWSSEPESLCNNWRGWKRPTANNVLSGPGGFLYGSSNASATGHYLPSSSSGVAVGSSAGATGASAGFSSNGASSGGLVRRTSDGKSSG